MDTVKLKSIMVLNEDTGGDLAVELGISPQTFSAKINGKADFTQSEIAKIKERYVLSAEQVEQIFFNRATEDERKV